MNKEKNLDKYLSDVRHHLRGHLLVIREGASQVLDGLGKENCVNCSEILKPVLKTADEMNKLIENSLNTTKFESILGEQQGAKSELSESEKNYLEKSKNELMGLISDMLCTPLTIIKEKLCLVQDEIPGKLNPEQRKFLGEVKDNVDRLVHSVEEILQRPWDKIPDPIKNNDSFKEKNEEI